MTRNSAGIGRGEELAALCEAATDLWGSEATDLTVELLAAFGLDQLEYQRAGWKFIYPENGRPGSSIWPLRRIEDFCSMLYWAGIPLPEMIHSDPRKACAAALRARQPQQPKD